MAQQNRWNRGKRGPERSQQGQDNERYQRGERVRAFDEDEDSEADAIANRYRGDYFDLSLREDWD